MSNLPPHPSLPARPPPSAGSYNGFMPRTVSRAPAPHMSAAPAPAPYVSGGYQPTFPSNNAYYPQQSTPPVVASAYPAPPGVGLAARGYGRPGAYDPEEEARIAEWQSAYTPKDDANNKKNAGNPNTTALGSRPVDPAVAAATETTAGGDGANKGKPKTVVRQGGGKTWEDSTLLEWDPLHPRLFVGNLAGEVTDDSLLKAFAKYPSVSKARVIRDKKSTKSKSYGFVSFANTDDYFRAAKEMEGKYIGSHPVRIKRANTEIQATAKRDDKHKQHNKNTNKKATAAANTVISGAPTYNYSGIQKAAHKKSGGPRILG